MRSLVISDIHGCYEEFCLLLDKVNYCAAEDRLILLGDYIDRGPNSKQVIEKVIELVNNDEAIALKGNHDLMLVNWLKQPEESMEWYFRNGGFETVKSLVETAGMPINFDSACTWSKQIKNGYQKQLEFLEQLPLYYEDEKHIFVHAGIQPFLDDWKETTAHDLIWIRDTFLENKHKQEKSVVHGHTPNQLLHGVDDIYFGDMKIGIDGGCAFGFQLNCLEISSDGYRSYYVESKRKPDIDR